MLSLATSVAVSKRPAKSSLTLIPLTTFNGSEKVLDSSISKVPFEGQASHFTLPAYQVSVVAYRALNFITSAKERVLT